MLSDRKYVYELLIYCAKYIFLCQGRAAVLCCAEFVERWMVDVRFQIYSQIKTLTHAQTQKQNLPTPNHLQTNQQEE